MKTAKEILKDLGIDDKLEIDTSLPYPKGLRYLTSEAMEIYADQQLAEYKAKTVLELTDVHKLLKEKQEEWLKVDFSKSSAFHYSANRLKELIDNL